MFALAPRQVSQVGEGKSDAVLIASCPRHQQALVEHLLDSLNRSARFQNAPPQVLKGVDQSPLVPGISKELNAVLRSGDLVRTELTCIRCQLSRSKEHPRPGLDRSAGRVRHGQDGAQRAASFCVVAASSPELRQAPSQA